MKILDIEENDNYVFSNVYHRSNSDLPVIYIKPTTTERKPKDTMLAIHRYVNELTTEKVGVPVRDSLFGYKVNKPTSHGRHVYKVYVDQNNTRFFINRKVTDFTAIYEKFSVRSSFVEYITSLILGYPRHNNRQQITSAIYDSLRNDSSSFDIIDRSIRKILVEQVDTDLLDNTISKMKMAISEIKNQLQEYVDGIEELSIRDIPNTSRSEIMVYSTQKIKLVMNET